MLCLSFGFSTVKENSFWSKISHPSVLLNSPSISTKKFVNPFILLSLLYHKAPRKASTFRMIIILMIDNMHCRITTLCVFDIIYRWANWRFYADLNSSCTVMSVPLNKATDNHNPIKAKKYDHRVVCLNGRLIIEW